MRSEDIIDALERNEDDAHVQDANDARMHFLTTIQERVPEGCGRVVPEFIESLADYAKNPPVVVLRD